MPHNFIDNNNNNEQPPPLRKLPTAMYLNRSCYCFMQHSLCCSRVFLSSKRKFTPGHPVYDQKNHKYLRMFQRVGISFRMAELLYEYFVAIDIDGSGEISLSEFFNFFRMKDTAFARRAFSVMDEDGSGEIDFGEFTLTLYNFCSFTREGLTRFAFELYDADGSGCIDMDECMAILKEMFGRKYKTNAKANKIATQMERFDWKAKDGMYDANSGELQITFIGFNEFVKSHPGILYPAFNIQMELQQNILGSGFWLDESRRQSKVKAMQNRVAKQVIDSGGEFASNEYMVVQSAQDTAFFEEMLSMSVNDAANDLYKGTGGKDKLLEHKEQIEDDEALNKGPSINTTGATNKLSKYRKKDRKSQKSRKRNKLTEEEKREKKKEQLKKKIKDQLKKERKRKIKKQRKEELVKKKKTGGIFGFGGNKKKTNESSKVVDPDIVPEDDGRRKLKLMKRDRVKSKKGKRIINVNADVRDQILSDQHDALPWICPTCQRSNYPDLKRCKTCHSLPTYKKY